MIGAYGRIVKRDSSGTFRWLLCFGGSGWEIPGSIEQTTDGNYILGGISFSTDGDVVGNHGGLYDLWVVKHGDGIPVDPPQLVVDARDSASSALIPGAVVGLYDSAHSEWQNVTADTGSYTFQGSGSSHQYPLVPGTKYQLAASAAGYSPAVRDVTFTGDGQRETVELAKVEPEVFTYSMTEVFDPPGTADRDRSAFIAGQNVTRWLGEKAGWKLLFNKSWADVTKADFGTEGGGLNDATLHWHIGHGAKNEITGDTFLGLRDFTNSYVTPVDVDEKWGGKNKWVVLVSCDVLSDENWGKALSTSHGIFGFKTASYNNPALPSAFFHYAMEENRTLYDSWHAATRDVLGGSTVYTKYIWINGTPVADKINGTEIPISAGVMFKTAPQLNNDHLPGYGNVEPDSDSNIHGAIPMFWNCSKNEV